MKPTAMVGRSAGAALRVVIGLTLAVLAVTAAPGPWTVTALTAVIAASCIFSGLARYGEAFTAALALEARTEHPWPAEENVR